MKKLLVVLLVLGLAVPASAEIVKFYGSVRTHLGYYDVDEDFITGPAMDGTIRANTITGDDDKGTLLSISAQSRVGIVAKASDSLSGVIEFGYDNTDRVYLRMAHGTWNFGAGKLTVGQHYTPATFLGYSGMIGDLGDSGDANMLLGGLAYIGRKPQLRLTFGGFDFALIEPNTDTAGTLGAMTDRDFVLPRIEAAYVFRTPVIAIRPIAGFQTYKIEDNATGDDETITSFTLGLGVSATLGPAYIKVTGSYLQNPGNYGQATAMMVSGPVNVVGGTSIMNAQLDAGGDVEDSTMYQGTFVVGAKINDMLGVEAGFGYAKAEVDAFVGTDADLEQQAFLYYLQVPLTVAQGVSITPEFGMLDRDDVEIAGVDFEQGKMWYFDVNFRVDF